MLRRICKRRLTTTSSRDEAGFTLVEMIVTIVVLGIVITGLGSLYYIMQQAAVRAQHLDMATRAARTEIEQLRNTGYSALTPGTPIDFTSSLPTGLPADKQGVVTVTQPTDDLRRVDVQITYTDNGKAQEVILSSNIGIIGIRQGQ